MTVVRPLSAKTLYRACDVKALKFKTTDDLEPLDQPLGQERAVEALRFSAGIRRDGYNLYALGAPGTGKHSLVLDYLGRRAAAEHVPADRVYVNNFAEPQKPRALELPAGRGRPFRDDMRKFVEELRVALPAAFESEDYRSRRGLIEEELKERQEQAFEALEKKARERNIALVRTPQGLALAPIRNDEVLNPKQFNELPKEEQERYKHDIEELQNELQERLREFPRWEREAREKLRELNQQVTEFAVGHLVEELLKRYEDLPVVQDHLEAVRKDVIEKAQQFLSRAMGSQQQQEDGGDLTQLGPQGFQAYEVNVVVDHTDTRGAPVVYEDNPTISNLIGRVEHISRYGALVTDFTLIRPGALHRANGGYLLLDARKLLMQPLAWEGLKRALRSRKCTIESPAQMLSLVSTVSLEPEPVPLDLKIVLVGDRLLYYLLCAYDPDFEALFKVPADFDDRTERNGDYVMQYARQIAGLAQRESIRPLDRDAVGRVIEHSARLADDSERLSTHLRSLADLLREADYWAGEASDKVVRAHHVQQAIDAQIRRADRIRERMQEEIERGTILIDTDGAKIGQINALSVIQLGEFSFGRPTRISARVRLGRGEVVDIERQVELGGPLHSKGVLILSGYLGAMYAQQRPLSLSASLVFEQSYGGVDGDSASSTELYALLSALAEAPIRQDLAVTGSVNQYGEVQAIGGVNEKIEGFFDICRARGLTGKQGVLIPASNVKHLMLRRDVVEAVDRGRFHVYPVETISQGVEILTGIEAGDPDKRGNYPTDSINGRVSARLDGFADAARRFALRMRGDDDGEKAPPPAKADEGPGDGGPGDGPDDGPGGGPEDGSPPWRPW